MWISRRCVAAIVGCVVLANVALGQVQAPSETPQDPQLDGGPLPALRVPVDADVCGRARPQIPTTGVRVLAMHYAAKPPAPLSSAVSGPTKLTRYLAK